MTLLDTDILSAIMRRESSAVARARDYLAQHSQLTISVITRYEILRGLHAKNAAVQLQRFEILCNSLQILPLSDAVIVRAAMYLCRFASTRPNCRRRRYSHRCDCYGKRLHSHHE